MAKLNIIVGTHGHFGEELVKSAELITGKMEGVRTLSLLPEMSFEDFMKNAEDEKVVLKQEPGAKTYISFFLFGPSFKFCESINPPLRIRV